MAESFGADAEGYDRNRPGCRVLGVEPDARMAGLARESGVEAFGAVYHRVLPDMPAMFSRGTSVLEGYSVMFTRAADGIRAADAFVDPEQRRFDWEGRYTRDEWLAQVPTFGGHSRLPSAARDELRTGLGAAIDAVGGSSR